MHIKLNSGYNLGSLGNVTDDTHTEALKYLCKIIRNSHKLQNSDTCFKINDI